MKNNATFGHCADIFLKPDPTPDEVSSVGDLAMRQIHGGSSKVSLGRLRFAEYKRRVLNGIEISLILAKFPITDIVIL